MAKKHKKILKEPKLKKLKKGSVTTQDETGSNENPPPPPLPPKG
jgi:hypothetical protein